MPTVKLGRVQKPDPIRGIIEGSIINAGITKKILAKKTGIAYSTLCDRMNHPEDFRRGELKRIFSVLEMADEEKQRIPW